MPPIAKHAPPQSKPPRPHPALLPCLGGWTTCLCPSGLRPDKIPEFLSFGLDGPAGLCTACSARQASMIYRIKPAGQTLQPLLLLVFMVVGVGVCATRCLHALRVMKDNTCHDTVCCTLCFTQPCLHCTHQHLLLHLPCKVSPTCAFVVVLGKLAVLLVQQAHHPGCCSIDGARVCFGVERTLEQLHGMGSSCGACTFHCACCLNTEVLGTPRV